MKEFNLDDILPRFIINSEGEKEPFDLERIQKSLIIDVGLDDETSSEIMDAVVRKIVGLLSLQYKSISTYAVKDFIGEEFTSRGLDKYRDIYERIEKKKRTKFVLSEEFIEQIADGRIFTGAQAFELGLVDELGGFERAKKIAGELAGILGEEEVAFPLEKKDSFIYTLFKDELKSDRAIEEVVNKLLPPSTGRGLRFFYMTPDYL